MASLMKSANEYLSRTESAIRKLFEGIESYMDLLGPIKGTAFISCQMDEAKRATEFESWVKENEVAIEASFARQHRFAEEAFAMSTLAGAVLQVAAKAIECYSSNKVVPDQCRSIVKNSEGAIPFCIGRDVRGVPLGLVVFAGRNQHTHHNESNLNKVNIAVFERIASLPQYGAVTDPAFDLANPLLHSYACNITSILGWRSYEVYEHDLRTTLEL